MPGYEHHLLAGQFLRDSDRLFGVTRIITNDQFDFLTEKTAFGIQVFDSLDGAAFHLFTKRRILARDRPNNRNGYFRLGYIRRQCQRG